MIDVWVNIMQSMLGIAAGLFIGAPNVNKNDNIWGMIMLVSTFILGFIKV